MFEMKTIITSVFTTNMLVTILLAVIWRQYRNRFQGMAFWMVDYVFQMLGFLLLSLRDILPDFLTIMVAQLLIFGGNWLIYIGLEKFVGKPSRQIHNVAAMLVFASVMYHFTYIRDDIFVRTIVVSLGVLWISTQCIDLLLRRAPVNLRPATSPVGIIFGAYALTSLTRIVYLVFNPYSPNLGLFQFPSIDAFIIFLYGLLIIGLTLTLNMMVSQRLLIELRESDEKLRDALDEAHLLQKETLALFKASRSIPASETFGTAARQIFDVCKELIGVQSGYVALLSEDGSDNEVLFLDAGGLPCTVDPELPMPIRGLRATAYQTGKAVYDNDFTHSEWLDFMPEGHAPLENVLFAPLNIHSETVGLIGLANKPGGFSERDARLAESFGDLIAVALKYAKNQEELRENEERFRAMFDKHGAVMLLIEPVSGRILNANAAAEKFYGYPVATLMEMYIQDINTLKPEEVAESRAQAMRQDLDHFTFPHRLASGEIKTVEVHSSPITVGGKPILFSIIHDITERRQAEEELRVSEEKFASAFRSSPDVLVLTSLMDGLIVEVNDRAEETLGYTREEAIGRSVFDLNIWVDPAQREQYTALLRRHGVVHDREVQMRSKSGKLVDILSSAEIIEFQGGKYILSILRDITKRKQAEEILYATTTRLETMIKVSPLAVVLLDREGNIQVWNPAAERMFGWSADEVLGKPNPLVPPYKQDEYQRWSTQVLSGVPITDQETVRQHKDGSSIDVSLSTAPIYDSAGTLAGRMAIVVDITARKQAELQLQKQITELRLWHQATLGREERIIELKSEVNELLVKAGKGPRYLS